MPDKTYMILADRPLEERRSQTATKSCVNRVLDESEGCALQSVAKAKKSRTSADRVIGYD